jgi:RNA polymerase sigma-70 factor (ECF subfamily)
MMRPQTDDLIPTRESLLSRLKDWGDQQSWRDFFDTYGKLIHGLALKSGLSEAEAQDVLQETLLSVAKQMPDFKYDPAIGSFKGWLLQITRWRIADQFGKRQPGRAARTNSDATETVERVADPAVSGLETLWEADWQRNLLEVAMARVKRQVHPKQYQMFDLYVTQQWPMELVTKTLGVNTAQVYMAKYRISGLIRKEIRTLETKMI